MSFSVHPWKVVEKGWNPSGSLSSESLFAQGNGYMGVRGSFEEDFTGTTHPGTYIGGVWFPEEPGERWRQLGKVDYSAHVLSAARLIGIHVEIDGDMLDLSTCATVWDFRRELDLRTGVLHRVAMADTDRGTIQVESWRFVSLARKELLAIRYAVTPSFACRMTMTPYLDGDVYNAFSGVSRWELLDGGKTEEACSVLMRTKANRYGVPRFTVAAAQSVNAWQAEGLTEEQPEEQTEELRPGHCAKSYTGRLEAGNTATIEKFVTVFTSRDHPPEELTDLALREAELAKNQGFDAALAAQEQAWAERWAMADVTIDGDDGAQQGIRFNLFQMLSTYSGQDARLNIAPAGFSGEAFGGTTHWDTEVCCFPVYLATCGQEVAKQLLLYRYQQLPQACMNARKLGMPGALYPAATLDGTESLGEWIVSQEEIHRNAAIAHAIFCYTEYTGDERFLLHEGFEVLLAIGRFYAGRAQWCPRTGTYMLLGVTGPDTYSENVDNDWYTNRMAAWCLDYLVQTAAKVDGKTLARLEVTPGELKRLRDIADGLTLPEEDGIFVQHDGFLNKELRPVSELSPAELPLSEHWSRDRIQRSCYIKQADVLQGLYFLSHLYPKAVIRRNFDFYEPLTVHESSLSPCIHSILAAQIGEMDKAMAMYQRNARLDLDNVGEHMEDGLHITSMPGSWLSIALGFAGMKIVGGLSFAPVLPDFWTGYAFKFNYRGRIIQLTVKDGRATLALLSGEPLKLRLYGKCVELRKTRSAALRRG